MQATLGTCHVAGWAVHAGVIAASGALPPFDVALPEEVDGSVHASDAWVEVLFFVAQGQEMRIAQSLIVFWMFSLGADGMGLVSEDLLTPLGSTLRKIQEK